MGKSTLIGVSVLAVTMFLAVSAQAGKPSPIKSCVLVSGAFYYVCDTNNELASAGNGDGYVGSCEGGGRCYDSVAQKLGSAWQKFPLNKKDDAWNAVCTILDDAYIWAYESKKAKLTQDGYADLKQVVQALAVYVNDKTCPSKD